MRDVLTNHRPEPKERPEFVLVGDYLRSTLNGLLDSADAATDIVVTELMKLRYARQNNGQKPASIDRTYFDNYRGVGPYGEVCGGSFTDPDYITNLVDLVWNREKALQTACCGFSERRAGRRPAGHGH